jgi:hypothetical protein
VVPKVIALAMDWRAIKAMKGEMFRMACLREVSSTIDKLLLRPKKIPAQGEQELS